MSERQHITHAIPPTYDERSRVLVLGTMPSPASRELGFNYGHPRNRFWQVMADLAHEPLPSTNERKRDFCLRHHIALWDVLAECDIEGASDASIRNAKPNPLRDILDAAPIEAVFCTGAKAHELYSRLCEEDVGMPAVKLPSTSPANAACSYAKLLESYAQIFEHEHPYAPPTLDVPDVVALEQAIAASGTSLAELMDRAGMAVAHRVSGIADEVAHNGSFAGGNAVGGRSSANPAEGAFPPLIVVLCGNGNNGGDGWVAAAELASGGRSVCVISQRHPEELKAQPAHDAAVKALEVLEACGATVVSGRDELPADAATPAERNPLVLIGAEAARCQELISSADVVVDAILGTGSEGEPREPFSSWISAAAQLPGACMRLAVDVPSGVSARTGRVAAVHFPATETLTMITRKPGLSAPECGEVSIAPLAYLEPLMA